MEYLIYEKGVQYLNTGFIQQDPIEGRFRSYRQLNGANYLCSVLQFLQAEKKLRVRALVKDGLSMSEIKDLFSEENSAEVPTDGSELALDSLADCILEDIELSDDAKSNIFFYAGYISRTLLQKRTISCQLYYRQPWNMLFPFQKEGYWSRQIFFMSRRPMLRSCGHRLTATPI